MFHVWVTVSLIVHLPRMFPPTDILFEKKKRIGLVSIDLFISYLHTLLVIINRSVSGLATDSPCGVWGRGLTTCLLCNGPILGVCY